jgi:glycosyltransferase involved in cell wall biosynthesis
MFLGYRSNIPEILAASNLFVLPTLVDALPTVLFEAMAAGLPIVVSNVGGVPEIVEDEVNGLLVPPADPVSLAKSCIRLLLDKDLCNRLSSAARATVASRFDVRQQASVLMALYSQMVTV